MAHMTDSDRSLVSESCVSHPPYFLLMCFCLGYVKALMLLTLAEIKLNFPENDASVDAQLEVCGGL